MSFGKLLKVFRGLDIPADYFSIQKYAILARSGGGKSYCLDKMLEQMCDAELFFAVLDPVGIHWSLRAGPDGGTRGGKSDVVVLGGVHGDVPITCEDGSMVADVVVDHPGRYVIDVSSFETDADVVRFATAFAKRLFRRKIQSKFAMLLVLEETETFVPQNPQPGEQQMLAAFNRIQKVGRNHGLGTCSVSQRPQDIAKKFLNQSEVLVVKQLAAVHERKAVEDWVKANASDTDLKEMMDALASLQPDDAYVWSPSWLRVFRRTKVLERSTFDASASAKHGEHLVDVKLRHLDVDALASKLVESREKAKTTDPKLLQQRVAELSHKLALVQKDLELTKEDLDRERKIEKKLIVEVPLLNEEEASSIWNALLEHAEGVEAERARELEQFMSGVEMMRGYVERAEAMRERVQVHVAPNLQVVKQDYPNGGKSVQVIERPAPPKPSIKAMAPYPANGSEPGDLSKSAVDIGSMLAAFHNGLGRERLALLCGKKPRGGSWNTALRQLRDSGLVEELDGLLLPTESANNRWPEARPMTGGELLYLWRSKLGTTALHLFDTLHQCGKSLTREELAQYTGRQPRGGSWNSALKELRVAGLIVEEGGSLRAVDVFGSDH